MQASGDSYLLPHHRTLSILPQLQALYERLVVRPVGGAPIIDQVPGVVGASHCHTLAACLGIAPTIVEWQGFYLIADKTISFGSESEGFTIKRFRTGVSEGNT